MRPAAGGAAAVAVLSIASHGGGGIAARRFADALADHTDLLVHFIDAAALGERLPEDIAPSDSLSNRTVSDVHFTVEHPTYVRGWLVRTLERFDVVNLHWTAGLVGLGEIVALAERGTPIILTLHDFHHLSGGCHYPGPCTRLTGGCHGCPQIDTGRASLAVPPLNRRLKADLLRRPNVHTVAPSAWLRDAAIAAGAPAERASVLRNPYAPPLPPRPAVDGAPPRVLLMADYLGERRKNVALAVEALLLWRQRGADLAVDLVGRGGDAIAEPLEAAGIAVHRHGALRDPLRLAAAMAEASLVLSASGEDNWPNVLVEAGSAGALPVVGPGHGAAEFVAAHGAGAVAADYTAPAFADALATATLPAAERLAFAARVRAAHDPAAVASAFRRQFLTPLARAS